MMMLHLRRCYLGGRVASAITALALSWIAGACAFAADSGRQVFNIVDFGAKADASELATDSFRKAVSAAKSAGGGTIHVPAGRYRSGPIELFSNMTLDVEAGAVIEFPVAPLPFAKGRYLGVETLMPVPLVGGHDLENVAITGRGILTTGDYEAWRKAYPETYQAYLKLHKGVVSTSGDESGSANGPNWDHLLQKLEAKQLVSEQEYRAAAAETRPSFVCFTNAKNVLVDGIRFIGAPMFVVHLLYSENATVRNVSVEAFPGPHVNGIVADSSRYVQISDSYIDVGDDGIVVKAGKDADGLRVNHPAENVTISNCTVHHAHGAVVIGSETSGSIRNVVANNITADGTENGIRIKSRRGRGGVVEEARFDNWTLRDVGVGIVVTSYYVMGGETGTKQEPVSERTPAFRNIGISHVTVNGAKKVVDIDGLPEMPISGLHLRDIVGSGKVGLTARFTDGLELRNVQLKAATGPIFSVKESRNLEMDGVTSRNPLAGSPVLRLTKTPGAVLRDSRAFPGTDVFLSTGTGELKSLHLQGNVLTEAKTATEER
jgi:polygalacturonase